MGGGKQERSLAMMVGARDRLWEITMKMKVQNWEYWFGPLHKKERMLLIGK